MPDLTRKAVNLSPSANDALEEQTQLKRENQTDAINNALVMRATWLREESAGGEWVLRRADGREVVYKMA